MMKMKRILSLVLALVMLVGMLTVAVSADTVTKNGSVKVTVRNSDNGVISGATVLVLDRIYDGSKEDFDNVNRAWDVTDTNGVCTLDVEVSGARIEVLVAAPGYKNGVATYTGGGGDKVAVEPNGVELDILETGFNAEFSCVLESDPNSQLPAKNEYIVTFYANDSVFDTANPTHGETVSAPTGTPVKDSYTFDGWKYEDGTAFDPTKPVTSNLNVYASWKANSPAVPTSIFGTYEGAVKVSCASGHHDTMAYGFKITDASQVTMDGSNKAVVYLDQEDRSAYLAWYNTDTCGKHTDATKTRIAITLEYKPRFWLFPAHWEVTSAAEMSVQCDCKSNLCGLCCGGWWHKHTVTYTDGVKNEVVFKDVTYTVKHGDKTPVPADPTRAGYKFAGWTPAVSAWTTSCVTYTATWTVAKTPDLTTDHVAYIKGYGKGLVKPEGEITRAEAITMLYRLMDSKSAKEFYTPYNNFTDVAKDAWYNDAVSTLANAGVLRYTSGKLNPNEAITRAEFFFMLTKFTDATYSGKCSFKDVPANHWAYDELALAQNLGWIKGYGGGVLYPDDTISRAEVAASLNRVLGRTTCTVKDTKNYVDNPVNAWYYKDIVEASIAH